MKISDVSHSTGDGVAVDIVVSPRSSSSGPDGFDEWRRRLIVRVKAPPLEGKANAEVEDIFKELTGFRSEVTSGHLVRKKTVTVHGVPNEIIRILEEKI